MAVDRHYILWDTIVLGTVPNAESILFQVAQGGDATHTENFTNSRGAGVLPGEEKFLIKRIHLIVDSDILPADIKVWTFGSFLELKVNDKTEIKLPAQLCVSQSAYQGHFVTATLEKAAVGQIGDGFEIDNPIVVPGATPWRVRFVQGTVLAVGSKNLRCGLEGILTSPM